MTDLINSLPPISEMMRDAGLEPKKSLGQNFLFDLNLTGKIARSVPDIENTTVCEVGPGPGGLTRALLMAGAQRVVAIEKDKTTESILSKIVDASAGRLEIIFDDALKFFDKTISNPDFINFAGSGSPLAEGCAQRGVSIKDLPSNPELKDRARELRKAGSLPEALLWSEIKNKKINGVNFDRQKIIGNYIVDFFCPSSRLIIEIDDEATHSNKGKYDEKRDDFLKSLGLEVIRFSAKDVLKNMDAVVEMLKRHPALRASLCQRGTRPNQFITDSNQPIAICANLPYNVGTELLIRWLHYVADTRSPINISSMTLMFQREVADRIVARVGDKQYGRLAVLVSLVADAKILFNVPNTAFFPAPRVQSAVVQIIPNMEKIKSLNGLDKIENLTAKLFGNRRKMIRGIMPGVDWSLFELNGTERAEELSPQKFAEIASRLAI